MSSARGKGEFSSSLVLLALTNDVCGGYIPSPVFGSQNLQIIGVRFGFGSELVRADL